MDTISALTSALNGLGAEGQRLEGVASSVASGGATASSSTTGRIWKAGAPQPVRVGSLPAGDSIDSMATMKEVALAYRLDGVVIRIADEMLGTLLDTIQPGKPSSAKG